MDLIGQLMISYLAVYSVIWLHEVGHAFFYWRYGCKKNFLKVTVKPYLFFSTPAPIEMDKLGEVTPRQNLIIGYGGIVVNIVCGAMGYAFVTFIGLRNEMILLFLWQFITIHLTEAISYLVLGNIYLVSDMLGIAQINPKLRPINFIFGIVLMVVYILIICQVPQSMRLIVSIYNAITIICMSGGRIIFTYIHTKRRG